MIFNFNTYLFFSAMAAGAAMALLLRVLINKQRRRTWDALSSSFLIDMIIAFTLLPLGLVISQWDGSSFFESIIFYFSTIISFSLLFYFLKVLTVPIVFAVLISTYLFCYFSLSDYKVFSSENALTYRVLKIGENSIEIEISGNGEMSSFVSIDEDTLYPEIIRLDLSPYLFVLPGTNYFKVIGLTDVQGISDIPDDSITLPSFIYNLSYVETPSLEMEILHTLEIRFSDDGKMTYFVDD